jgi:hypothetical protein
LGTCSALVDKLVSFPVGRTSNSKRARLVPYSSDIGMGIVRGHLAVGVRRLRHAVMQLGQLLGDASVIFKAKPRTTEGADDAVELLPLSPGTQDRALFTSRLASFFLTEKKLQAVKEFVRRTTSTEAAVDADGTRRQLVNASLGRNVFGDSDFFKLHNGYLITEKLFKFPGAKICYKKQCWVELERLRVEGGSAEEVKAGRRGGENGYGIVTDMSVHKFYGYSTFRQRVGLGDFLLPNANGKEGFFAKKELWSKHVSHESFENVSLGTSMGQMDTLGEFLQCSIAWGAL